MASPRRSRPAAAPLLLLAALCALCIGVCACASPALAAGPIAKADAGHASAPAHKAKRHRCTAKGASFHTSGGARRHASYRGKCHNRHHAKLRHHVTHQQASHTSSDGDCPNADARPSAANLELVRAATLCLVNRERTTRGEGALAVDPHLEQAAQGHSQDMFSGDYFNHIGRGGDTPLARMRASGYIYSSHVGFAVAENIGWGTLWLASPRSMVASWMASPGHRANILNGQYRDSGIGISPHPLSSASRGQAGAIYTQDFGVIVTR